MSVLQICAVALGGKNLASLCRIFCGDFKQFSSGAPDLHMIRACLHCQCCQRNISSEESESYEQFGWKETLGDGWNQQHSLSDSDEVLDNGGRGIFHEFFEDAFLRHEEEGSQKNQKKTFFRNKMGKLVARNLTIEEQFRRSRSKESKGLSAENSSPVAHEVVDLLEEEEGVGSEESQPVDEGEGGDVKVFHRKDPFECLDPDLALPLPVPLSPSLSGGRHSPHEGHEVVWSFETIFVEVKGPTDRLSDTQQRWIHILNSNGLETVVCQVKEGCKGMGIAGGYHKSSSNDVTMGDEEESSESN